jgi:uncharacterized protein YceK
MAQIHRQGSRANVGDALLALSALTCIGLTGCGSAEKTTTSTVQTPGGTVTTTSTTGDANNAGGDASVSIDAKREVEPHQPIDANNTTVEMGAPEPTAAGSNSDSAKVQVDLPGVHINVNKAKGTEDIDVPFVHIHKD